MKVLLLNPPARKKFIREGRCTQEQGMWTVLWPPLSLAMIAAVLEGDGHEVKLIDCPAEGVDINELCASLVRFSPDLCLWSTATPTIESDLALARRVKEEAPECRTAIFGTHPTALPTECLEKEENLDFIIRNEPEETARELAEVISRGSDFSPIKGLSYRDEEEIIHNPARGFIDELDSLPDPAWHFINLDSYRLPLDGRRFLIVAPIRGCPYPCTFCTTGVYYGRKARKRSVPRVLSEIKNDIERYGVGDFLFWADTFTIDKKYAASLCRAIIEEKLDISWVANSRVDTVDKELLALMRKAGCFMISYGIESGSKEVLRKARKGITRDDIKMAVRSAKEAGIKVVGHFIIGLPGETKKTAEDTILFSKDLELDFAQFYCAAPFPGSELYNIAKEEGWITGDFSYFSQRQAVMELSYFSRRDCMRARRKAYRRFYFQPRVFFGILKKAKIGDIFSRLMRKFSDIFG
jgi:anaerobic magnesium-protoporphyrin IX monomethyl ester cyclase